MTTLGTLHRDARARLIAAAIPDAALDARLLVEAITATSRADLLSRPEIAISSEAAARLMATLERRAAGEPVHRILGARDFYGLRLALSPGTLEPRPDTEALVDLALDFARRTADASGACRILDLGTGTGAIPLALLSVEPRATALATDIDAGAIATATANAEALGLADRIRFALSDWFGSVDGQFDLIVSNPPYIPSSEIAALAREVRDHDPLRALDGGADGLWPYRAISEGAAGHLAPDGVLAVEIGAGQESDVVGIFAARGFHLSAKHRDLGGHERALAFMRRTDAEKAWHSK